MSGGFHLALQETAGLHQRPRSALNPAKHSVSIPCVYGGFPKLGAPFLALSIIGSIAYWGLYLGPLF